MCQIYVLQVGSHPNLVSLIGVVTIGSPLLVIISHCSEGSLRSYLQRRKMKIDPSVQLSNTSKLMMALDIALGMEYFASHGTVIVAPGYM